MVYKLLHLYQPGSIQMSGEFSLNDKLLVMSEGFIAENL
jgi:hypothetical protein